MSTQQQDIVSDLVTLAATVPGIVTVTKYRPLEEPYGAPQLPAINIGVPESDVIDEHSAGTDERMTVIISVFCVGATAADTSLDYLAAMLGKIGADETLGGKAIGARKGKRAMMTKHNESISAEAHHEITIDYRTPRWNF